MIALKIASRAFSRNWTNENGIAIDIYLNYRSQVLGNLLLPQHLFLVMIMDNCLNLDVHSIMRNEVALGNIRISCALFVNKPPVYIQISRYKVVVSNHPAES